MDREWLSVKEVAELYDYSIEHIRRMCNGEVAGVTLRTARLNKKWLIHRDSLERLIQERS